MTDYDAIRRSPYYVKSAKVVRSPKKPGPRKQRCEPRLSAEIFGLVSELAATHSYSTSRPSQPLVRFGPHLLIEGKRCRVGLLRSAFKPKPNGPVYIRGSVSKESLSLTDYHVFVVEVEPGVRDTYIMPSCVVHDFLFGTPTRATRKESTTVRVLNFPLPANPCSRFEPYRNAWALLA